MQVPIAAVLTLLVANSLNAQTPGVKPGRAEDSLRGLKNFYVEAFVSEQVANLVPAPALTADIEEQVRQSGLTVVVRGNAALPLSPAITVDIDAVRLANATIVYTARIDFSREVRLDGAADRPGPSVIASTWSTGIIATATDASVGTIRLAVRDLVDRFLNLHLQANR